MKWKWQHWIFSAFKRPESHFPELSRSEWLLAIGCRQQTLEYCRCNWGSEYRYHSIKIDLISIHCSSTLQLLTASLPATPSAAGWSGRAAACRWDPAASRSWAASAQSGPSSGCSRSSTPCCGASPCREWSCNWLSRSVDGRVTDGFINFFLSPVNTQFSQHFQTSFNSLWCLKWCK